MLPICLFHLAALFIDTFSACIVSTPPSSDDGSSAPSKMLSPSPKRMFKSAIATAGGGRETVPTFDLGPGEYCGFSELTVGQDAIEPTLYELRQTGRALAKEFPWQAYITVTNGPTVKTCSGAVIDSKWVLTTASCIYSAYHDPDEIVVFLGAYNQPTVSDEMSPSTFSVDVESVHYHPRFDTAQFEYDYAMLKLTDVIDFSQWDVQPICTPQSRLVCEMACSQGLQLGRVLVGWLMSPDAEDHSPVHLIKDKRPPAGDLAAMKVEDDDASKPSLSVMSMRILQKFGKPRILSATNCLRRGFPSVDNKTRFCIEATNEPGVDECSLHPGSLLLAAFKAENNTGVQFTLCGLKSAPQELPPNNCVYSAGFSRRSISMFANFCSAVEWINSRNGRRGLKTGSQFKIATSYAMSSNPNTDDYFTI